MRRLGNRGRTNRARGNSVKGGVEVLLAIVERGFARAGDAVRRVHREERPDRLGRDGGVDDGEAGDGGGAGHVGD
jgi:hypothetical protein